MRRTVFLLGLLAAVAGSACGGSSKHAEPPREVPVSAVPATIDVGGDNGKLTLSEFQAARKDFAKAGSQSLVDDGKLWEVRRGATLVGTLQVSTFKHDVDVSSRRQRNDIVNLVMPGSFQTINLRGTEVITTHSEQKTTYMWFGNGMFELLQVKAAELNPERILRRLLAFQKPLGVLDLRAAGKATTATTAVPPTTPTTTKP